jgi:hypothetical protein
MKNVQTCLKSWTTNKANILSLVGVYPHFLAICPLSLVTSHSKCLPSFFLGSPFPMKHAVLLVGQSPFSILMVYPMLVNASWNYFIWLNLMSFKRFINFCRELSKHNSWLAIKIPYFTELQVVETIKIWLVYLCFTRKKVKCTKLLHRCGKAMKSHGFPRKIDEHCLQMVYFPHRTVGLRRSWGSDGGGGINALHHLEGRPYVGPHRWGSKSP